ncbi:MAG: amylo-alpha-1,6-glucosidase [Bacteroidota bacterium]
MNLLNNNIPDHENALTKEWIITNGIGGYASSTIIGTNTRRYHGLLIASLNPPTERKLMVSKVEETILHNHIETKLSTNQYVDAVYPEGYYYIKGFTRTPLPTTLFRAGEAELSKTIFMVYNSNTTVVEYTNASTVSFRLRLNPLYAVRDYHSLLREEHNYHYFVKNNGQIHSIYAYAGAETLHFMHTKGYYTANPHWNKNILYTLEKQRGQEFTEDLYSTGTIEYELKPGETMYLLFSLDENKINKDPAELKAREIERLNLLVPPTIHNKFLADLFITSDQFIVHRKSTENYSIIAGYHWFTDWGRDSMIALRGLCIATGKQKEARSVITTFLNVLNQGIIPNRFADYEADEPEYHTMDATLWLFVAVYEYDRAFKDTPFLKMINEKLTEIIHHHVTGTKHNIHITEKGFLCGGTHGLPLSWMDARIGDNVFTPRVGCPVEINVLWYNALRIHTYVLKRLGHRAIETVKAIIEKIENNFENSFWNSNGYLNDLISEEGIADTAIRPNQIYAVSLPYSLLPLEKEKMVVENVNQYLLTDYGLRTLEPNHPEFKPEYSGDVWSRDAAYHQGTVWPFLIPEYFTAYLKVHNYSNVAKRDVENSLQKLKDHFYQDECLHGISEIFDGLNPGSGKGCMNQAWSVSNLIFLIKTANLDI